MRNLSKNNNPITGVLLINLGTPDTPTFYGVAKYLREFLSDPRVVEIPRIIWFFILYAVILPFRSRQSAKLYQSIWQKNGSPLRIYTQKLAEKLQIALGDNYDVITAMRYGTPAISTTLENFQKNNVGNIIVLPLFPQYSGAVTGSILDHIMENFKTWRVWPKLKIIRDYYDHPDYIDAIVHKINKAHVQKIVFSFHGLPQKFVDKGDVYQAQCYKTVSLITQKLGFSASQYAVSFQSRLGRARWLTPYTDEIISNWPAVICPGFAVDCLETLEEIQARHKNIQYISALNDSDSHIKLLKNLIQEAS